MGKMNGAQSLVNALEAAGVEVMFPSHDRWRNSIAINFFVYCYSHCFGILFFYSSTEQRWPHL